MSQYWYTIAAYNGEGMQTDMSEPVSAVTRGKPPVPQHPAAKGREPKKASIRWDIVNSPDDEVMGYAVFRSLEANGRYEKIAEIHRPGEGSFIDKDPPLQDNTTYYYRISSFNSVGAYSELSDPVSSTTKAPPVVPAGLTAASGEVKRITLAWNPVAREDISGYTIYRSSSESGLFEKIDFIKDRTRYEDTGLKDGERYSYCLEAVDDDNLKSGLSSPVTAVTKPLPVRPSGLRLSDTDGKRTLLWDANPEEDIKEYIIYKKGVLGISTKLASIRTNSWILEGIKGKIEIFLTAMDETALESEASDILAIEGPQ